MITLEHITKSYGDKLAVDVDKDGDLDLLVSAGGKTSALVNDGGNANGWLDVVLEGLQTGSGKVNKQGVGSLVEVKAGNLYVAESSTNRLHVFNAAGEYTRSFSNLDRPVSVAVDVGVASGGVGVSVGAGVGVGPAQATSVISTKIKSEKRCLNK